MYWLAALAQASFVFSATPNPFTDSPEYLVRMANERGPSVSISCTEDGRWRPVVYIDAAERLATPYAIYSRYPTSIRFDQEAAFEIKLGYSGTMAFASGKEAEKLLDNMATHSSFVIELLKDGPGERLILRIPLDGAAGAIARLREHC